MSCKMGKRMRNEPREHEDGYIRSGGGRAASVALVPLDEHGFELIEPV